MSSEERTGQAVGPVRADGSSRRRAWSCTCGGRFRRVYGVTVEGDRLRWLVCRGCGREAFYYVEARYSHGGQLYWHMLEQAEGERLRGLVPW